MCAVNELNGKIWRKMIEKSALPSIEQRYAVISTKLLAGRTVVHVYSEQDPGNGFEHVEADLEDVYFCTMAGHYVNGSAMHQEVTS